jgi:RNA polymerase-binding protein DksA
VAKSGSRSASTRKLTSDRNGSGNSRSRGKSSNHKAAAKSAKPSRPAVARKASAPLPKARSARTNDVASERREERRDRTASPAREQAAAIPGLVDAVPTDGKPRKNQAGLSMRELEHFRDLLLAKRRELVGDMSSMEREALRNSGGSNLSTLPIHMADMGTDNYEQEFTLGLVEKDRNLLREINNALAKIQNGTYGICEGTSQPISKPRLEAQPWARYSIEYARTKERGMLR